MKQNNSVCPGKISLACTHIGTIREKSKMIISIIITIQYFFTYVYPLGTKMKADNVRQMIEKKINEKRILE